MHFLSPASVCILTRRVFKNLSTELTCHRLYFLPLSRRAVVSLGSVLLQGGDRREDDGALAAALRSLRTERALLLVLQQTTLEVERLVAPRAAVGHDDALPPPVCAFFILLLFLFFFLRHCSLFIGIHFCVKGTIISMIKKK